MVLALPFGVTHMRSTAPLLTAFCIMWERITSHLRLFLWSKRPQLPIEFFKIHEFIGIETNNWTKKYWASQIASLQLRFLIYEGEISLPMYTEESRREAQTMLIYGKVLHKMSQMVVIVIKMLTQNQSRSTFLQRISYSPHNPVRIVMMKKLK